MQSRHPPPQRGFALPSLLLRSTFALPSLAGATNERRCCDSSLALVWGKNGSGKTSATIVTVLQFVYVSILLREGFLRERFFHKPLCSSWKKRIFAIGKSAFPLGTSPQNLLMHNNPQNK
jgi:hypothetical protein